MNTVTIQIGDDDIDVIDEIFKNEKDFDPKTKEDKIIVEILKQIQNNPKIKID